MLIWNKTGWELKVKFYFWLNIRSLLPIFVTKHLGIQNLRKRRNKINFEKKN